MAIGTLNSLDYDRLSETVINPEWLDTYGNGFKRLKPLLEDGESYNEFLLNILMANPPFAGDVEESRIIQKYDLV